MSKKQLSKEEIDKIIKLRDEEGLTFTVIAERLGMNKGSPSSTYKREKERRFLDRKI